MAEPRAGSGDFLVTLPFETDLVSSFDFLGCCVFEIGGSFKPGDSDPARELTELLLELETLDLEEFILTQVQFPCRNLLARSQHGGPL
mmetsp:Transcript_26904/g.55842  ORF Transcript_26904/g.55842 Transcript_26904/m.55842 type:complete len:88 (-) Transcript_26904:127-390(-)